MARLMRPRSVAVLGASSDPNKFSGRPLVYMRNLGFTGRVYPVNPEATEIAGYRCYRSIMEISDDIDAAVIARPAAHVPAELEQCLARGIRAFVVFSGGFAEAGDDGAALQKRIAEMCRSAGAVMCGPNGTGVFDAPSGAAMSFMSNLDQERAEDGTVALVSGSGSIAAMLYQGRGRVFRSVASIGNEAVTTAAEFVADAIEQPGISGVIAFLETIRDPRKMGDALRRANALGKPVAILKGGRTQRSAQVAATHTGALVDDDAALQAMLAHHNAIRADCMEELKLLATLMHAATTRRIGRGVGVLTPSGGTAVLIVDELERHGLDLPELCDHTRAALKKLIPQSSPANPMDITGFGANSQEVFASAITTMLADAVIDVLIVPMGGAVGKTGSLRAAALIEAAGNTDKLLVPIWQGTTRDQAGYDAMLAAGLPVMTDYALLVKTLGNLVRHRSRVNAEARAAKDVGSPLPTAALDLLRHATRSDARSLSEPEVKAIFRAAGIAVPSGCKLTVDERPRGDMPVPFPAVLKVVSGDILHKSAVGGVAVVQDAAQLPSALQRMSAEVRRLAPQARVDGYLLEEMVPGGLELLVGIKRDERYGALLTLALGGTWANSLRGAVSALLPLDEAEAQALMQRFFTKLDDDTAGAELTRFLLRLSAVAEALGERLEVLEVNPLKLIGPPSARVVALDGVLTLNEETTS